MSVPIEIVRMAQAEFDGLLDYSCSLPTGTTIGKRWKRGEPYYGTGPKEWFQGEYVACDKPDHVGIKWSKIEIVDATPTKEPKA